MARPVPGPKSQIPRPLALPPGLGDRGRELHDVSEVAGESAQGRWSYCVWRPRQRLGVDAIWHFEGPSANLRKRILPSGMVEILVNFAAPYRLLEGRGDERLGAVWLGGLLSSPHVVAQPAYQSVLGVRLRPAAACALLARPLRQVSELQVDLGDLIGGAAAQLAERCHAAPTPRQRVGVAAAWVAARLAAAPALDPAIAWSAEQIRASDGGVPIADLRERTGLSKARLAGAFREWIGLTPKLYARVVRFQKLTEILQRGGTPLVDAAVDAGYYDQPHMNADFRALAGITPLQYLAARHPVGDGNTAGEA